MLASPVSAELDLNKAPLTLNPCCAEVKPKTILSELSIDELLALASNDVEAMCYLGFIYLNEGDVKKGLHFLYKFISDKTIEDDKRAIAVAIIKASNPDFIYTEDFRYNDDPNSPHHPMYKYCSKESKALSPYQQEIEVSSQAIPAQVALPAVLQRVREFELKYDKDMDQLAELVDRKTVEDNVDADALRGDTICQEMNYRLMKTRFALEQGGKRSGGRVYYIVGNDGHQPIRFLRAFKKSDQEDLSPAELNYLQAYFQSFVRNHGKYAEQLVQKPSDN